MAANTAMNEALKKEIDYLQLRTKCLGDQVAELFKPPETDPSGTPESSQTPCPSPCPPVCCDPCGPCVPCGPCCVKIPEVHPTGSYIKILNTSCYKTECLSCCYLVQMRCGKYVTMYTFPPCVYIYPQGTIRVWSCGADPGCCRLLNDLVFKELCLWCSGSDVTTLLCRCDGAVITWLVGCGVSCTSGCCSPRVWPC